MAISNTDEYIDGREAANELEELRDAVESKTEERDVLSEELLDFDHKETSIEKDELLSKMETLAADIGDLEDELKPLAELEEDINYFALSDVSLISRNEFEDYCMRFAIDCGDISEDSSVFVNVDWEAYASGMEIDYTSVDFDGEEYLYNS